MTGCPQCGSTEVRWTGMLGHLTWASCRACGAEYATPTPDGSEELTQDEYEAEQDYLATCAGHYLHEQDEIIDPEVY